MWAMAERLQKLIARAGIASRRTAEKLIQAGAVSVNGRVVKELGTKADPERDRVEVQGRLLRFPQRNLYILLHKPRGCVTTISDPEKRPTVFQLLRGLPQRVFPVGRLPFEVEGLLLATSDGDFADAVLRGHLPQTFSLKVKGSLTSEDLAVLQQKGARAGAGSFSLRLSKPGANPWYEVRLVEPRGDWLRTLFFRSGHPVERVRRVALGSLELEKLPVGQFRELTEREVARLKKETAESSTRTKSRRRAG